MCIIENSCLTWMRLSAERVVDQAGVLPHTGPLASFLDNPLMPSGATLFVSAMVMLLDFSRPKWAPVSAQARDWVVRCLNLCATYSTLFVPFFPQLYPLYACVVCARSKYGLSVVPRRQLMSNRFLLFEGHDFRYSPALTDLSSLHPIHVSITG
jgi:hypothetical protein